MGRQYKVGIGLRTNYGMQAFYRTHGIEPRCGICRYFSTTPVDVAGAWRECQQHGYLVTAAGICHSPEREPGADDE